MPLLLNADKWPTWYVWVVLMGFLALTAYMAWHERH
jgi:hypothetical protein